MASNPMQRQARNYFLLGMALAIIIAGIIIAFLFMQMKKVNEQLQAEKAGTKTAYVLTQDIKSGQVIDSTMFEPRELKEAGIPADATGDVNTLLSNYSLCDKSGNNIYVNSDGSLYMRINNSEVTVYREAATDSYYTQGTNGEKSYIETVQKSIIAKVDMKANTVITNSLIARADEIQTDDVRRQEYNMLSLPIDLMTGDYVDVRFMLPNGQDFIVVSKKQVTIPDVNGAYLADTIQMNMSEEEILSLSCAIVEAYRMDASKLYVTKYTEAGLQEAATPNYAVNNEVANEIDKDPNIVQEAKSALSRRYSGGATDLRNNYINGALSTYGDTENVPTKVEESITSTQEARQQYLQGLTGAVTTTTGQ